MRAYIKALLLFTSAFGLALLAHKAIVPNVVPVADGEQSNWQVQVAFILVSIELIGLGGVALVVVAVVSDRLQNVLRDRPSVLPE